MVRHPDIHLRPKVLVVLLVALALLVGGMRVPDVSRPHRPKPKPRAVVSNPVKNAPEIFKQSAVDYVAVIPASIKTDAPSSYFVVVAHLFVSQPSPQLFSNSGRSPPLSCV